MQRSFSSATADRSFSMTSANPGAELKLTDPSALFRRLDGPPPHRPLWMTAVAIAVLAVVAAGGAIAFQDELRPLAPHVLVLTPGSVSHS